MRAAPSIAIISYDMLANGITKALLAATQTHNAWACLT
jgi:hypothetical protein